jgi:hypothetical protein
MSDEELARAWLAERDYRHDVLDNHRDDIPVLAALLAEVRREARREALDAAIEAVLNCLRHTASGYALLRTMRANGARDALYRMAEKLERDWGTIVRSRTTPADETKEGT